VSARELITEHLELWTGAVTKKSSSGRVSNGKVELTGIKKLRELILQLAVMGRLVKQDAEDEPASSILESIDDEIANLVKQGCIRFPKRVPSVDDSDKAFEIPESWQWVRLGNLALHSEAGWSPKCHDTPRENENWGVLKVSAVTWGQFQPSENKELPDNLTPRPEYQVQPSDFLISRANTAELVARSVVVPEGAPRRLMMSDKIIRFVFSQHVDPLYVNLFNNSSYARAYYLSVAGGTSSSMKNVSRAQIQALAMPLPPKTEQHRIVQKVDELMALCDRLEQHTSDQLEAHETLVDTLLGTLTQSEKATELADNWARLAAHFDTLFTTEQSIDKLKQTILQLAVMGRLVEQNFSSADSSPLLQKIESKRAQLVQQGKLKGSSRQCISEKIDAPFNLPANWSWVRVSDLLPDFQNGASSRGDKSGSEVIVLRLADITNLQITLNDPRRLLISNSSISKYAVREGHILIIRVNGSADLVGRFIPVEEPFDGIFCDHFIRMRTDSEIIDPRFFALAGSTNLVRSRIEDLFVSTAGQKTVNQKHIGSLLAPLPPIEEQHRIVQKVHELMALCDQLKERLSQATETRNQLAAAVVEGAQN
tara:strand:- start:7454 stop:9241 length:1788 start_codon:yes stop_codon:yes gene_type:complete